MLVLTRKRTEKIVINREIVVTVLEICNGKVRLGIDAPREIPVMRQELVLPASWQQECPLTNSQGQDQ